MPTYFMGLNKWIRDFNRFTIIHLWHIACTILHSRLHLVTKVTCMPCLAIDFHRTTASSIQHGVMKLPKANDNFEVHTHLGNIKTTCILNHYGCMAVQAVVMVILVAWQYELLYWQHKPHVAILWLRALTPQSSVAVTHLHTGCCSFYLPQRGGIPSWDCLLGGWNPDLLHAHREHASEWPTT